MGFTSITAVVSDAMRDGQALRAADRLAARLGAHLDVICLGIDPVRYADVPNGGILLAERDHEETIARARNLADWARLTIGDALGRTAVQTAVVQNLGFDHAVSRLVRYSDLVVSAKPYDNGRSGWQVATLDAALFGTSALVMIVPDRPDVLSGPLDRIMIGWNESDEALAAVRKSLPALKQAKQVDVVMVDPPRHSAERSDPGGLVSLFLARHGIRAEVSILSRSLPRVSDVLMRFAHDHNASAMVMGAYGHSRLREALLGGVTRDILQDASLPILMAR